MLNAKIHHLSKERKVCFFLNFNSNLLCKRKHKKVFIRLCLLTLFIYSPTLSAKTTVAWADPLPGTHHLCNEIGIACPSHATTPMVWRAHQVMLSAPARESHDMVTHIAVFQISPLLKGYDSRRSQRPPWRCSGSPSHSPSMGGRSASFQR